MIVGIADLGIGNFAAMAKMVAQLGGDPRRMTSPSELAAAERLILPGVGAFSYAVSTLDSGGWRQPLQDILEDGGRPVLAVCVGMQLLVDSSEEGPGSGLGWVPGRCVRFSGAPDMKVPHMGWNDVTPTRSSPLFPDTTAEERFYFVHSYHVDCSDAGDVTATADYHGPFTAAVQRDNVLGVQFHPEKSHRFGLRLLRSFMELPC
jgi:glutamine amidotransferase